MTGVGEQNRSLFVVGMPRSGTKLLMNLLNNHSSIAIPGFESHFIPHYLRRMQRYGNLKQLANFRELHKDLSSLNFFTRLKHDGFVVSAEQWHQSIQDWSFAGILATFYLLYARRSDKTIWGDKTPYYMLQLPVIAEHFPAAKFIHVIRDPRDQCLSSRKAWNKNIYRSAQRWRDYIRQCRNDGRAMPGRYHEIYYEALLDDPPATLEALCAFIGVAFEPGMVRLTKPTEFRGDAKNQTHILKHNYQKWKNELTARQIRKIESICGGLLTDLGYAVSYEGIHKQVGVLEMLAYRSMDSIHQILFEVRKQGSIQGLAHAFRQNRLNRN
jgi:hypothetical protein